MARGLRGRSRPASAARAGSLVLGCLLALGAPVPNAAVWQWYDEQLRARGWDRRPQVSASHAEFTRQVGGRRHTIDVEAGSDEATPDAELSVHSTIGYADDWRPG